MPKVIPVKSGLEIITVEFPDDMGGPEIEAALAKRFGDKLDPAKVLQDIATALGKLAEQVEAKSPQITVPEVKIPEIKPANVTLEMPDNTEELLATLDRVMIEIRGLADAFSKRAAPAYELTTTRDKWGNLVSAVMQPIQVTA